MLPKVRVPVHPGEILREEFAVPYKLSQVELAERLDISRRRVNELLTEKRGVTADTAVRLAKLFGTSAQFWMNLQATYDLVVALKKTDTRSVKPISSKERKAAERAETAS